MTDFLTFAMGKFEVRLPTDRVYARNHLWLQPTAGNPPDDKSQDAGPDAGTTYRVGFTAYSVRLLQDVYFLDWTVDPGTAVRAKQAIGEVESSKALSTLYVPAAGTVVAFNEALLADPSAINVDGYGGGWLYEFATTGDWLSPAEYLKHLEAGWEQDQRYLKGQVNEG